MEIISSPFNGSLRKYWRRRRYQRLDGAITSKKSRRIARLGGKSNVGHLNNASVFGGRRIPKARQVQMVSSSEEIDPRFLIEIYKALDDLLFKGTLFGLALPYSSTTLSNSLPQLHLLSENMEILSSPFHGSLKRYWRRRRYQRLNGAITGKNSMKIARLGGKSRRFWKIRAFPKLRLKIVSPIKLLARLRDGYINMMLGLESNVGYLNNASVFGDRRIPKARQVQMVSTSEEFDPRFLFEIYKSLMASSEFA
ncbi:hypothetical protein HHK36_024607 [Tetracentron sinense]|uniref:Uncharacterized protein n=1 Tax=Tetracentron sinense TaxID=13715 RepID=A0A834YNC1_TETSI|nr:hypothetical protein HHK36_024607 [Tetracentron sinense]